MGASLPEGGQAAKESSSQQPVSSGIDMHISQEGQRYHNPDPLLRLIGPANEATIIIEGQRFLALVDSGAQLSTMSESLVRALKLPIHNIKHLNRSWGFWWGSYTLHWICRVPISHSWHQTNG